MKKWRSIAWAAVLAIGLPALICPQAGRIEMGDSLRVDLERGLIENETKHETYRCEPLPANLRQIIARGGLMESLKQDYGPKKGAAE